MDYFFHIDSYICFTFCISYFSGPGGGAGITLAQEGETKIARFKLLYPGLYVYHCAAAPVPVHVMNGMYGLMLIEPEYSTLPAVDKEYYVMQSEFYTEPLESGSNIAEASYPRGLDENADVVVFNGKQSALRENPLKAKTGESVRIYCKKNTIEIFVFKFICYFILFVSRVILFIYCCLLYVFNFSSW
jgi:FtsP/CotA-like multicopper oxidase with cupredoxin domain